MTRAVLAVTVALLSACSSSVEGFARPAALVTTSPQTAAAPLAVEPGHLEPLALTATDIQTMVGTRPFAVVSSDSGTFHVSAAAAMTRYRPSAPTWRSGSQFVGVALLPPAFCGPYFT